jgi:nucleoside-diphosphate-sugar epimerase
MQEFWKDRKVLITGGAGFIGSNLAARLVSLGSRVRVADGLERGRLLNLQTILGQIESPKLDLRDPVACDKACEGQEVVFHLASKVGGINYYLQQPAEVMTQNLLLDINVWKAAESAGAQFYFYASSAHVYPKELQASPASPLLREEDAYPANPELSYGWAKLMGEKMIEYHLRQGSPLRAAIVRLIGVYGPHQDIDLATGSAIPVFTRRAIEYPGRQPFTVLGSGDETRSYCYIEDVLDAMLLAVEKLDVHQLIGPLNIGSEEHIRIGDLARMIINISGKKIPITYDRSHQTVIWGQALDCSKAERLLDGWRPRVPLVQGLRCSYEHISHHLARTESTLS